MKITRQEVEQVAHLARLELQPEEVDKMTAQLDDILGYAAKLEELDTTGTATLTTGIPQAGNAFREDECSASLDRIDALKNAPEQNGEAFVVPRIIT